MLFGEVAVEDAEGAILAHSCMVEGRKMPKGTHLGMSEVAALQRAGIDRVTVARMEAGDAGENEAADALARALVPDPEGAGLDLSPAFTGRVNIKATGPGMALIDVDAVARFNRVDHAITLATVAPFARVEKGTMVGTVKVITYGVPRARVDAACAAVPDAGALRVQPVALRDAGLVLSEVPGQSPKLSDKAEAVMVARLTALGMKLAGVRRVRHAVGPIAEALAEVPGEMVMLLTGSATSDPHDVGPEGVRVAGGRVDRFGMPVDPGNLLFIGALGARPVLGLPGCARSPALNGLDWVLERMACGIDVTADDIASMGVGGLLKEIPTRPQPRNRRERTTPGDPGL